jgi:hypothetical protein
MCIDDGRVVSNFVAQVCALSNLRSAFWTLVVQNETTTWKRAAVFNLWRSEQASNFVSLIGTSQGTNDHLWWWKSNSELPICLRFGMFLHKVPLNSSETNRDSAQQKNLQVCLKVPSSWIVTKHVGLFWQILQHEILGLCSEQEASWYLHQIHDHLVYKNLLLGVVSDVSH